jgi:hypothetical protein
MNYAAGERLLALKRDAVRLRKSTGRTDEDLAVDLHLAIVDQVPEGDVVEILLGVPVGPDVVVREA